VGVRVGVISALVSAAAARHRPTLELRVRLVVTRPRGLCQLNVHVSTLMTDQGDSLAAPISRISSLLITSLFE